MQVFEELNAYEPTRFLAASLSMAADTPGIQGLPSWRLLVAARTVQRPDKDKSWPLFQHIAETCTEAQYLKLIRKPAPTATPTASAAATTMQNFNPGPKIVETRPTEEEIHEAMKTARIDRGKRINPGLSGLKHWVALGYLPAEILKEFEGRSGAKP